jgi:tripartite-type tricarboxylate transporter receptor subunit TctC
VPTVAEAGYPGFEIDFFEIMLAPAAIPEEIRAMLQREVQRALESPDVKARLRAQGLEPIGSDGAEARDRLRSTAARWRALVKAANIQLD